MSYVEKLLTKQEEIALSVHDHWITLLPTLLIDGTISLLIIGLVIAGVIISPPFTWLGLLLLVIPVGHSVLWIWRWQNQRYLITNRRILQVTGTFNKRVSDTPLDKINDILMEQSAAGRMLGYGDVKIISGSEAGTDVFRQIAKPIEFKKAILEQQYSPEVHEVAAPSSDETIELEKRRAS